MTDTSKRIKGIKVNGQVCSLNLSQIGSYVGPDSDEKELTEYIDSKGGGSTQEIESSDGSKFILKVNNDGTLYAKKEIDAQTPTKPDGEKIKVLSDSIAKLYINSFYCGGLDTSEHTMNYCSHNFIELSNLTNNDIKLDGLSLQYLKGGSESWADILPLHGVIRAGHTFLIRGAQCSPIDAAKIIVDDYDMEWYDGDNPIKFTTESPSFFLCFGVEPCSVTNPGWTNTWPTDGITSRFIDLVGIKSDKSNPGAYEKNAFEYNKDMTKALFKKYYSMDAVSQGNKVLSGRTNSTEWCYVDLTKDDGDLIPSIENNAPKSSYYTKNLYYDKTKLLVNKPSIITCSFGIQATDGGDGKRATRCFNWVSKGRHDEFIWIRKKGESSWGQPNESYKNEIGVRQYYNRIFVEYADGSVFTSHKFIKKELTKGVYEYIAGRSDRFGQPIIEKCTDIRTFTVRTDEDVNNNGFKYVQTSDQQGFNWEEYRIWEAAGKVIENEELSKDAHFMINTGDMTQNGSRMNEWLDYFNAKSPMLNNMEEMATIGNNDLSGKETYTVPDGSDGSKLSLANFNFFYTYEIDESNPPVFTVKGANYFIPSLYSFNYGNTHFMCINSEIKGTCEEKIYNFTTPSTGNFYPKIKEWCETDIEKNSSASWKIAYCHEMPFTIMTTGVTNSIETTLQSEVGDGTSGKGGRGGANINTNMPSFNSRYWLSEFCQTHNIRLVMGGHKHTQSTSWPLLENVSYNGENRSIMSFRPVIVLSSNAEIKEFSPESTELKTGHVKIEKTEQGVTTVIEEFDAKYPDKWVDESGNVISNYLKKAVFCEFILKDEIPNGSYGAASGEKVSPVLYAMSQATSYKHTSNKELPSDNIPWLRYYYPASGKNAASGQKYPFYTVWSINSAKITGNVRKVVGAFGGGAGSSNGKFDINLDGEYVLKGKCATDGEHNKDLYSINGIKDKAVTEIIEILK